MYTLTQIYQKWKLSKPKIQNLLDDHNVQPVKESTLELSSMVYLQRYTVQAKYYDVEVIEDLFRKFELRK